MSPQTCLLLLLVLGCTQASILKTLQQAHFQGNWQGYVDDQLVGTGSIRKAIIIGVQGGPLAESRGFSLQAGEAARIVNLFKNPNDAFAKGITVAGVKYFAIKAGEQSIYGKRLGTGIILAKTSQLILIGFYDESQPIGSASGVVEKVADFLRQNGY